MKTITQKPESKKNQPKAKEEQVVNQNKGVYSEGTNFPKQQPLNLPKTNGLMM